MKTIEIVVNPQGEVKLETKGFTGSSCREASKALEGMLGEKKMDHLIAEFYAGRAVQEAETTSSYNVANKEGN